MAEDRYVTVAEVKEMLTEKNEETMDRKVPYKPTHPKANERIRLSSLLTHTGCPPNGR